MPYQRRGDGSMRGVDEVNPVYFQSARFYSVNSDWYFSVRECEDKGPYGSKEDAERAFNDFIALLKRPDFQAGCGVKH